jgi:beta-mannosidase
MYSCTCTKKGFEMIAIDRKKAVLERMLLHTAWEMKERDPHRSPADEFGSRDGWLAATVPGTVHTDLLAAGRIPDPFIGLNELAVQWVGEREWLYRSTFSLSADTLEAPQIDLCFAGLDTIATVWLNGQLILSSDNMFVPHRVAVKPLLREGANELWVLFGSAFHRGKQLEAEHGVMEVWNGDPSRVYVRKAQYHYGWDWGPTLLTAGFWREVSLEAYSARISEIHAPVEVSDDLRHASIPVTVTVEQGYGVAVRLTLYAPSGEAIETVTLAVEDDTATHRFEVSDPQLWWPNGYGTQPLYRVAATLNSEASEWDRQELKIGIRRLRLLQEPLEDGTGFLFQVNNTPIFCGGVNWIPADMFTPRISDEKYRTLLEMTASAHMTMVRVWGGGIYEADIFYDLCDELGLLVWQDFMFGCGLYPAYPDYQASVRAEAEAQVKRLRHHPSLALWCGNNEDYMLAYSFDRYDPTYQGDLATSPFPARALYEEVLPDVCTTLDPMTPYWRGSPYGGANGNSGTVGDRHTWDVWHGAMAPYQAYPDFAGRFVSEFGMQALPALATIREFADPAEQYAASRTLEHHNKATDGPRRLAVYMNDTVKVPTDLAGMVYGSQLVQGEALASAFRGWRRRFRGQGRYEVSGALVWQLNDCWPVTSWAIVDSALRPKPAYYVIGRELAPVAIGLAHTPQGAAVWGVNTTHETVHAELVLTLWTLEGERLRFDRRIVTLASHQATDLDDFTFEKGKGEVLSVQLLVQGKVVHRAALWSEPFKYYTFPDPELTITQRGNELCLRVARPAKGVWLSAGDGIVWSDNMLDLFPGDEQWVTAHGFHGGKVSARYIEGVLGIED